MLALIRAALFLCLFTLPALADGGPNSIRICDKVSCRYVDQVSTGIKFGTYTPKARKQSSTTVIAGKTFKRTPSVSHHSDANAWINEARKYKGMTGAQLGVKHKRLWCGEFIGRVARTIGKKTPRNPNWAADWAEVGSRIPGPQVGAIALIGKRRIHHVGLVTGVDAHGNPIILSGNHNDRVMEAPYPRASIAAYIWPET